MPGGSQAREDGTKLERLSLWKARVNAGLDDATPSKTFFVHSRRNDDRFTDSMLGAHVLQPTGIRFESSSIE
jgi:hypothetical protein